MDQIININIEKKASNQIENLNVIVKKAMFLALFSYLVLISFNLGSYYNQFNQFNIFLFFNITFSFLWGLIFSLFEFYWLTLVKYNIVKKKGEFLKYSLKINLLRIIYISFALLIPFIFSNEINLFISYYSFLLINIAGLIDSFWKEIKSTFFQ